jgi:hypothetical protein
VKNGDGSIKSHFEDIASPVRAAKKGRPIQVAITALRENPGSGRTATVGSPVEIEQVSEHLRLQDGWNHGNRKDQQEKSRVGQNTAHVQLLAGKPASFKSVRTKVSEPEDPPADRESGPASAAISERPYIYYL